MAAEPLHPRLLCFTCAHMKTQKLVGQVPLTMAGPRLRAGLMEQPAWTGEG